MCDNTGNTGVTGGGIANLKAEIKRMGIHNGAEQHCFVVVVFFIKNNNKCVFNSVCSLTELNDFYYYKNQKDRRPPVTPTVTASRLWTLTSWTPSVHKCKGCNVANCFYLFSGATTAQQGPSSSSPHYPVTNQFTMGGPAISMASPMAIPSNTMHYGS